MMMLTVQMVRALRGAPITVLVLMALEGHPVSQAFVRRHTGYANQAIHDSLEVLRDYGLINEVGRYQWQICANIKQFPLTMELEDGSGMERATDVTSLGDVPSDQPEDPTERDEEIRSRFSRPSSRKTRPATSSSSRYLTKLKPIKDPLLASNDSQLSKNESKVLRSNLEALQNFGIREPARSRIAKLEHVTPEKIEYHCQNAGNLGLAIYRIEHDWAVECDQSAEPGWKKYTKYLGDGE